MGRSTTSCFKIIACGSDSAEQEDIEPSESKGSSDKRGWSFRKRSARHRVLSNTVLSEMPSSVNKDIPESTTINLQDQSSGTFTEKTSTVPWIEEKPQSPSVVPKVCNTIVTSKDENLEDVSPDEAVIVVIQTAIRGFLAQRELLKVKNIVKLQAAVRGHLVRRHAVGTLRCVQAIVKMQALVRARLARLSSEEKFDGKHTKDNRSSNFSDKGNSVTKPLVTHTSIEKLLGNKFANQLMESTPRTKSIHIKCDPSSRSDSAWNWLERWMSVSSTGAELKQKPESKVEQVEHDKIEDSSTKEEIGSPTEGYESTDLKANTTEAVVPFKTDQDSMTSDSASPPSSSSASENLDAAQHESLGPSITKQKSSELFSDQIKHSDSASQMEFNSVSSNSEMETEPSNKSVKRAAPEEVETEGKRFAFGTRKATNPAFIAVQSKFEELSTTPSSARSTSSQKQTFGGELNSDAISSSIDNEITTRETDLVENSVSHTSTVKVGGSECGTELSITSTLDSSDRFEIGGMDVEKETELKELGSSNSNRSKDLDNEANGETASGLDLSYSVSVQPERHDNVDVANEKSANSVTTVSSFQEKQNLETNASSENIELGTETGHQSSKSSREASPRSHMTIPEFQGTPSSQVSIKAKRSRSERGSSNQKHRASSAGKASPSNPNHNSGSKSSLEPIPKDHKTGKRRSSFGSGRSDYVDQEPRDSSSSNSLPSYMQATESARAKALANSSPRSSPDVQEKEIYIKKRHSLPGANGKQGSPRVQQSKPQAHQSAKGNGHPHERKWQR